MKICWVALCAALSAGPAWAQAPGQSGPFPPQSQEASTKAQLKAINEACASHQPEGYAVVVRCLTTGRRPIWNARMHESIDLFEGHHALLLKLAVRADQEGWTPSRFQAEADEISSTFQTAYDSRHRTLRKGQMSSTVSAGLSHILVALITGH